MLKIKKISKINGAAEIPAALVELHNYDTANDSRKVQQYFI